MSIFNHPMVTHEQWEKFTQADHQTWQTLFKRQSQLLKKLASTLYWFTVEFGVLKSPQGLRAYIAGIISSKGELIYSLKSKVPARVHFNLLRLMKTQYHINSFQKTYFVISSLNVLFQMITDLDWNNMKRTCNQFPEIEQGVILHTKEMIGDQR